MDSRSKQSNDQNGLTLVDLWSWPISHGVSKSETNRKPTNLLLDFYNWNTVKANEQKLLQIVVIETHGPSTSSWVWASLQTQKSLKERRLCLFEEGSCCTTKNLYGQAFSHLFPTAWKVLYQDNGTLGEGKWADISGANGHWFSTNTDSRIFKMSLWPFRKSRGLWKSGDQ